MAKRKGARKRIMNVSKDYQKGMEVGRSFERYIILEYLKGYQLRDNYVTTDDELFEWIKNEMIRDLKKEIENDKN